MTVPTSAAVVVPPELLPPALDRSVSAAAGAEAIAQGRGRLPLPQLVDEGQVRLQGEVWMRRPLRQRQCRFHLNEFRPGTALSRHRLQG